MSRDRLREILLPTPMQVLASILASLALFGMTYRDSLWARFISRSPLGDPDVRAITSEQLTRLSGLAATEVLVKIAFWSGVGLVAYVVFLIVNNAVIEARNQVVIQAAYTNKGAPVGRLRAAAVKLFMALILVLAAVLAFRLLLPQLLAWFELALAAGGMLGFWLWATVAVLGCSVLFYALWTLAQVIRDYL